MSSRPRTASRTPLLPIIYIFQQVWRKVCSTLKLLTVGDSYRIAGQAPRGSFRGRAPPNEICAPKRGLCPEEINRFDAIGVQFEAKILVITLEFVGKNCFFRRFCHKHRLSSRSHSRIFENSRIFWEEDLFFLVFTSEFVEIRVGHFLRLVRTLKFK